MNDSAEDLQKLVEALDDELPEGDEVADILDGTGLNVAKVARGIRARLGQLRDANRLARFESARQSFETAQLELHNTDVEPVRPVAEQRRILAELVGRLGKTEVRAHFQKFESAGPDELATMIASLRHLLKTQDGDSEQ